MGTTTEPPDEQEHADMAWRHTQQARRAARKDDLAAFLRALRGWIDEVTK